MNPNQGSSSASNEGSSSSSIFWPRKDPSEYSTGVLGSGEPTRDNLGNRALSKESIVRNLNDTRDRNVNQTVPNSFDKLLNENTALENETILRKKRIFDKLEVNIQSLSQQGYKPLHFSFSEFNNYHTDSDLLNDVRFLISTDENSSIYQRFYLGRKTEQWGSIKVHEIYTLAKN